MRRDSRSSALAVDPTFLALQEAVAGRYAMERELGRGGMGVVYLARDVRLDRPVAIKLLPPSLAGQDTLRDRFLREARTAARLSHPHIVPIHSVEEASGFVFYVMSFVDGETLAQRVAGRGPLSPGDANRVLREVASALACAHAQAVVHRDVKPANILLEHTTGRAMVTDFGIARVASALGDTAAGELVGTPEYMSPEQAAGEAVDARSDIYALGVVGFYAVSGTLPFSGPSVQSVLTKQITQLAPPVGGAAPGLPRALAGAIDRCLAKDPADRFATAEALAEALTPAVVAHVEVPIPVRAFLDPRKLIAAGVATTIGIFSSSVVLSVRLPDILDLGIAGGLLRSSGFIGLAISLAIPVILVVRWLRPLLRAGYGAQDIAAAIRSDYGRKREEHLFEHGSAPTTFERRLSVVTWVSAITCCAAWGALALGAVADWLWPVIFVSGFVYPVTGLVSATSSRKRKGAESWWEKRWDGRMGRWLTKLASINLGRRAAAADRPTEMAIAFSAKALLDELPADVRATLGDVQKLLQALEERARAMRGHIKALDASIAEVRSGPGAASERNRERHDALVADLQSARDRAAERMSDLVAALESTRLDLLRLRAGQASTESITAHLEAARQLGGDVDRLVASQVEVEDALRRAAEPTPV